MAKKQSNGLYRTKVKIGVDPDGNDIVKWVSGKTKKELEDAYPELMDAQIKLRDAYIRGLESGLRVVKRVQKGGNT